MTSPRESRVVGDIGADVGVLTQSGRCRGMCSHEDEVTRKQLLTDMRAEDERNNAALKVCWRALRRVSLVSAAVSTIAAAALVVACCERQHGRD